MSQMTTTTTPKRADAQLLHVAALLFAVAVLVHNGDHLRRGGDATHSDVFWIGTAAIVLEVAVVALAVKGHRWAPSAAALIGFPLALGYLVVHFTPARPWLSDSFLGTGASPLSWVAGSLETVAALALGMAGVVAWRGRRVDPDGGGGDEVSWAATLAHPAVAALVLGNLVILAGSLLTRS